MKYKSEKLKEIILNDRINNYNSIVAFVLIFIALTIVIGIFIEYPKKIIGNVFIVSKIPVNKVYSPNNGKINILVMENSNVEKGELLATIVNTTNYEDILLLKKQLFKFDINNVENSIKEFKYNSKFKLGDIEKNYYSFLLALLEYKNILEINISKQKIINLQKIVRRNKDKLFVEIESAEINNKIFEIKSKEFKGDSILFSENAMIKDKFNDSKIILMNVEENGLSIKKRNQELKHINKQLLDDISLLKKEKEREILIALFKIKKTFFELKTTIDSWEHNYLIKAPINGKIEYYKPFFNSEQYVKKEMPLFIILPQADSIYARGIMAPYGYGEMNLNDTVHIKLNDYPFKEYGVIKGVVHNKSKVYHDSVYYVDIKLINKLETNQNKRIEFNYNMSGQLEYFTNKRSIIQRIFGEI